MIPLTTAKLLLFVALCLGPKDLTANHVVQITSNGIDCIWTQKPGAWNLIEKSVPTHDWPANGLDVSTQDLNSIVTEKKDIVRAIARHDWSHDGVLVLENGDRAEKQGNKVFYTAHAGSATQEIYTILTLQNGVAL